MIKKFFITLLMAVGTLAAMADSSISLSNATGIAGEEVDMSVSLNSNDDVAVAEIKIPLNRYLKYVESSCALAEERSNGHQINAAMVNDSLRIYIYNMTGNSLNGTDGTLCTFRLKLGKSSSKYTLTPKVLLGSSTGDKVACSVTAGSVTIKAPSLALGSTTVNYGKVAIRKKYTKSIILKNNGTSLLTVSDVQFSDSTLTGEKQFTIAAGSSKSYVITYAPTARGTLNAKMTLISDATNGKQSVTVSAQPYSVNELHVGNASGKSDEEVEIKLDMNNMEKIVAVQCSFTMPNALEYVDGSLTTAERSSHLTSAAMMDGSKLTLYLISPQNAPINGESGTICSFKVKLNGTTGSYKLTPTNVILAIESEENLVSATSAGTVTISSPIYNGSSTLNMGRQDVTKTVTASYSIKNSGKCPLIINKVNFLSEDDYSIAESLPLSINAGTSQNITVQHNAKESGSFSTIMQIYTNDPSTRLKSVVVSGSTFEPNSFSLDGSLQKDAYYVNVLLDNYTEIVAAQLDLHVPDGITVSTDEIMKTQRLDGVSFSFSKISDNTYRAIVFSLNNNAISGNEGTIFTMKLHGTIPYGKKITADNVVQGTKNGENYASELVAEHTFVRPSLVGDVNEDERLTIVDVTELIDMLKNGTVFSYPTIYDINEDNIVNVDDINLLSTKILTEGFAQ